MILKVFSFMAFFYATLCSAAELSEECQKSLNSTLGSMTEHFGPNRALPVYFTRAGDQA